MERKCASFYLTFILIFSLNAVAQNKHKNAKIPTVSKPNVPSKEDWRKLGYQAKVNNQFMVAIENYEKVLNIDNNDYDALLATAKLHFKLNNHQKALERYLTIYEKDATDVEALNGIGECCFAMKKNEEAIIYFQKAISFLPKHVPLYLNLAKVYLAQNNLKLAKKTYEKGLVYDNTYAEAWAGIGKIYYWENKPKSALTCYLKARHLDPTNEKIETEYKLVRNEMAFTCSAGLTIQTEEEEVYKIKAILQRYELAKRINNYVYISLNTLADHSKRITPEKDTINNFDNTQVTTSFILNKHRISLFLGASASDSRVTAYGISWLSNYTIARMKIKNIFSAGYDYFYYWRKVDQDYYSNYTKLSLYKLDLELSIKRGIVRENYIWDYETIDINPYISYNIALSYVLFKNPKIIFGINHAYVNYTAHSLLYYSPYQRKINGVSFSSVYIYKKLNLYGSIAGRRDVYENNIWSAELEAGYNFNKFNISAGCGNYNDPYYKNSRFYLVLKKFF